MEYLFCFFDFLSAKSSTINLDLPRGQSDFGEVVGEVVSDFVGDIVGELVGDFVGDIVGVLVGDLVGDFVGDFVGVGVGGFEGEVVGGFIVLGEDTGEVVGITSKVGDIVGASGLLISNISSALNSCESGKFSQFGQALSISSIPTPNQFAIPWKQASHGVEGITLPLPIIWVPSSLKSSGYVPSI